MSLTRAEVRRKLREQRKQNNVQPKQRKTASNAVCNKAKEEEQQEMQDLTRSAGRALRKMLPPLLKQFEKIPDPRNPLSVKHKLTVLLLYGILLFFFRLDSRRQANRVLSRPQFRESIQAVLPELETLPHGDTLNRLLSTIDVEMIQEALAGLVRELIRKKVFTRFLRNKCYQIVVDGTRKNSRDYPWADEALRRKLNDTGDKEYYIYIAEVNLVLSNGLQIPLTSEILHNDVYAPEASKQDCELKAFYRLAKQVKQWFPRLRVCVALDGLYAVGPVMKLCCKNKWDYMIVLKDKSLPTVWEEAGSLRRFQPENTHTTTRYDRKQVFCWVNNIEYQFNEDRERTVVHLVECTETYTVMNPQTNVLEDKTVRFAWLSRKPINHTNVTYRCNEFGRQRWMIEESILKEKRHGFQYEHLFSTDWTAMKGYHYLMRIGHLLNEMILHLVDLAGSVYDHTEAGVIALLREALAGPWLDIEQLTKEMRGRSQLRLVG